MPNVFHEGPYRVYFFSREEHEPPHVHVVRENKIAKFWLEPVALAGNAGFASHELNRIQGMIESRKHECLTKWYRHLGPQGQ